MKKDIAEKWVAALRSGEYKQGRGALKTRQLKAGNELGSVFHCCLGVLCELAVKENVIPAPSSEDAVSDYPIGDFVFGVEGDLSTGALPKVVQEWSGLDSAFGNIDARGISLASLNDSGRDFDLIAVTIEENVDAI